jgi:TonB family protein
VPGQAENPDIHLQRLLAPDVPWYKGFIQNVKDLVHPKKLPPLEVTSKPAEVQEMWGLYSGNETRAGLTSMMIHVAVIGLIVWVSTLKPVQKVVQQAVNIFSPDLSAYKPAPQKQSGGGGGGARAPLDASKGKLPKIAPKQFTPPRVDPVDAKLPMTPTIVSDTQPPNINALNYGDPLSRMGISSGGSGLGGGIGTGSGGGVGSGRGPGFGPGSGGGFGGGVYRIGGGVSQPTLLSKVEPEYSEEARKAKWQGTVVLSLIVDEKGQPQQIKVSKSLGLGLDQKAIEAVEKWRFKPGMKDGKAVAVYASIEVNFRLL